MADIVLELDLSQSTFLPHYKNLLPTSNANESNSTKKSSKRSSSSYRERLERIKNNCQLIRERRRRCSLFSNLPIELRPSLFQQRHYQSGALELLNISPNHWQSTNALRLSDEYLYKCKYAMYATTNRNFKQKEFYFLLRELFSCSATIEIDSSNQSYQCQLCDSSFHSADIFHLHLNRRSVSIQYQCLTCQSLIQTTNPCQAYYHLLLHPNSTKEKRLAHLSINCDPNTSLEFIGDTFTKYCEN
ncbi:unnamed protein product [Adineta ricciae]|uniref:C2H2-type domain-containing protein n=1 Tax=Adineta ricciae TaxID=249248 RepID=A0A813XAJ7_ADIRI|nr:unnamed protein product [Adineta ricciae]CAF1601395.1 unnamed protein product [Adineta ricciae]